MPKPTEHDKTHRRNMAAIGTRIDRLFKKAADEAARIGVSIKSPLPDDKIFSFDDYPETRKQIERLLAALNESMEVTIANGVRSAWTLANDKNNALASRIFGDNVGKLTQAQYRRYFSNNGQALDAFLQRKEKGLNLSDRVWRYTTGFKREIELGLDVGLRNGLPAAKMARELQQWLKYPDMLFRRVRDKHGILRLSQRAKAFHPGRGVYRSSYRNARRLAVTETNIAYHTADYLRWQTMDFVVGIEIRLSGNHTIENAKGQAVRFTDMCDTLAGRYPKDFKFTGWHPHCRCQAISILKTEKEMAEDTRRILDGKRPSKTSENSVTQMPDNFTQWCRDNEHRIDSHPDTLPYFIRDNRQAVDKALGRIADEPKLTPQQIAGQRHAERDDWAVQSAWNERRAQALLADPNLPEEAKEQLRQMLAQTTEETLQQFNDRVKFLQGRAKKLAQRTPEQAQAVKDAWAQKLARDAKTKRDAQRVLDLAKGWGATKDAVSTSVLEALMAENNLTKMGAETDKVMAALKAMRAEEKALADLIPDVHGWHKQFTMAEIKGAHEAIQKTFNRWTWDYDTKDSLQFLRAKLETEIAIVKTSAHKTREIARQAYEKRLAIVTGHLDNLATKEEVDKLFKEALSHKSLGFKKAMYEANAALYKGDYAEAKAQIAIAKQKKAAYEAKKAGKNKSASMQTDHIYGCHTTQEKIDKIKELTGCTDDKAQDYLKAVQGFSWQWDYEIRQVQCGNMAVKSRHGHTLAEIKKRAEDLEEFIEKSPQWGDVTTYRGMSLSEKELEDTLAKLADGTFHNFGSASWSTDFETSSDQFAMMHLGELSPQYGDEKQYPVVLILKKQKRATSIRHLSLCTTEDEVLASMKNRYRLVKDHGAVDGFRQIEVEAI